MNIFDKELELLISQRNQLVSDLANINSSFRNTILALLAGIIALLTTSNLTKLNNEIIILIGIQLIILIAIYIEALLTAANIQRFYISAIDTYIEEKYKINCLFYQGNFSRMTTLGGKGIFPYISLVSAFITVGSIAWIAIKLDLIQYICKYDAYENLTIFEIIVMIGLFIYNEIDKKRGPKNYKLCLEFLKRKEDDLNEKI